MKNIQDTINESMQVNESTKITVSAADPSWWDRFTFAPVVDESNGEVYLMYNKPIPGSEWDKQHSKIEAEARKFGFGRPHADPRDFFDDDEIADCTWVLAAHNDVTQWSVLEDGGVCPIQ